MKWIYSILNVWRTWGGYVLINLSPERNLIKEEMKYWFDKNKISFCDSQFLRFTYLVVRYKEYRNLLKFRFQCSGILVRILGNFLLLFLPPMDSLKIYADRIGRNFYIEHGIGTIISAEYIGDYCWINQQVTVGYNLDNRAPIIHNGVRICAGAKVLGGIVIGNNVIVGANAVVIKNVENDYIVAGIPAKKIKKNEMHILCKYGY